MKIKLGVLDNKEAGQTIMSSVKPKSAEGVVTPKQPYHEMTREDFIESEKERLSFEDLARQRGVEFAELIKGDTHKFLVQQALSKGKLSSNEYNVLHAKDYGEWGSREFNSNFPDALAKQVEQQEAKNNNLYF